MPVQSGGADGKGAAAKEAAAQQDKEKEKVKLHHIMYFSINILLYLYTCV